jgi:PPOX class probable F420-dependent enzyme
MKGSLIAPSAEWTCDVTDHLQSTSTARPYTPGKLGKTAAMTTFPESHRDLLDGQVASLATIDGEGLPQLTEVWFLFDDGDLKLSLNNARQKVKNLAERPQCSVMLLDLANPYRYLEVRGRARLDPDDDYAFAGKVGAKYGADLKLHDQPGDRRFVVTIEPVKIHPVNMGG